LFVLCLLPKFPDWPSDPPWLAAVNEQRLTARAYLQEDLRQLFVKAGLACKYLQEALKPDDDHAQTDAATK